MYLRLGHTHTTLIKYNNRFARPSVDGVSSAHLYFIVRAASSGTRMRGINQRVVTFLLIGVVNAACFFAPGCATLCAWASCPHRLDATPADNCHHRGDSSPHPYDE